MVQGTASSQIPNEECGIPPSQDEVKLSTLHYSKSEINKAGKFLSAETTSAEPLVSQMALTVSRWRSSHEYALRKVISTLRRHVRSVALDNTIVSARTKRLSSIVAKLKREPSMALTTMQDVGGCRVVVARMEEVDGLANDIKSKLAVKLSGGGTIREYNYIVKPKMDRYRSVHFVVGYKPDDSSIASRRIEIQIRSLLQHRWATAVETVDLFTSQALKTGGGDSRWRQFFALTASLFALKEKCLPVPGLPTDAEQLSREMQLLANELRVVESLQSWSTIMRDVLESDRPRRPRTPKEGLDRYCYLVEIDVDDRTTKVTPFPPEFITFAHTKYLEAEQRNARFPHRSAVLATAYSLAQLREAYPGYYGDTYACLKNTGLT
ncbi:MAG: RelA/SpoT domain protein [Acidobacteriaceae bacterium]|nr:RelA/SpoT domain protein [Acidobacteriaceae bacterium]